MYYTYRCIIFLKLKKVRGTNATGMNMHLSKIWPNMIINYTYFMKITTCMQKDTCFNNIMK